MHVALAGGRGRDDDHLHGTPRKTNLFSHHSAEAQRPRKRRMITTCNISITSRIAVSGRLASQASAPSLPPTCAYRKTTNDISECFVSGREQSALSCPSCCTLAHIRTFRCAGTRRRPPLWDTKDGNLFLHQSAEVQRPRKIRMIGRDYVYLSDETGSEADTRNFESSRFAASQSLFSYQPTLNKTPEHKGLHNHIYEGTITESACTSRRKAPSPNPIRCFPFLLIR